MDLDVGKLESLEQFSGAFIVLVYVSVAFVNVKEVETSLWSLSYLLNNIILIFDALFLLFLLLNFSGFLIGNLFNHWLFLSSRFDVLFLELFFFALFIELVTQDVP